MSEEPTLPQEPSAPIKLTEVAASPKVEVLPYHMPDKGAVRAILEKVRKEKIENFVVTMPAPDYSADVAIDVGKIWKKEVSFQGRQIWGVGLWLTHRLLTAYLPEEKESEMNLKSAAGSLGVMRPKEFEQYYFGERHSLGMSQRHAEAIAECFAQEDEELKKDLYDTLSAKPKRSRSEFKNTHEPMKEIRERPSKEGASLASSAEYGVKVKAFIEALGSDPYQVHARMPAGPYTEYHLKQLLNGYDRLKPKLHEQITAALAQEIDYAVEHRGGDKDKLDGMFKEVKEMGRAALSHLPTTVVREMDGGSPDKGRRIS